jgi:prepilin-type N-terminal cleavage/methylation domain-containing protein
MSSASRIYDRQSDDGGFALIELLLALSVAAALSVASTALLMQLSSTRQRQADAAAMVMAVHELSALGSQLSRMYPLSDSFHDPEPLSFSLSYSSPDLGTWDAHLDLSASGQLSSTIMGLSTSTDVSAFTDRRLVYQVVDQQEVSTTASPTDDQKVVGVRLELSSKGLVWPITLWVASEVTDRNGGSR